MQGLAKYESELCACGWHESLTGDKSNHFTFEDRSCPVCAAGDRYMRIKAESDDRYRKALGDDPPANRNDPSDGRRTLTRRMSAEEVAEHKAMQ